MMRFLQAISAWLAKWTPLFITLVAVGTYFVPDAFGWVRGDTQTAVLGVIMLTMGMTLKDEDFKILASRPQDMVIGALAQFTFMPLIAWTLVRVLGLPREVGVGLMLVGCCPGGVSSNIMSFLCKGDVAFSVGMTTVSTLAAPLMTPFLMLWLAGETVDVDAIGMFKSILIVTILPIALGYVLNALFQKRDGYREALKVMPGIAVLGLACIVGGVVSAHGASIVKSGVLIFVGVFLHNSLGYVLGYSVGKIFRFNSAKKRTIAIEVGVQNAGMATVLAAAFFANPDNVASNPEAALCVVPCAISCAYHSISGTIVAEFFARRDRKAAARHGGEV